ncbi:MAG: hypothetical protein JWM95_3085 [Gemmatimonadetes bacterium]|nr:hypothetical protein [Gemmatimonadota bacterium]
MPLRSLIRNLHFAQSMIALGACVLGACADGTPRAAAATVASRQKPSTVRDTIPRAQRDSVDSLMAARRATIMDTTSVNAMRIAPEDSSRRRGGSMGPKSGDRHLAFRDMGGKLDSLWPVKGPEPLPGSILPARRIVAFYGNPLSKRMGILGEFAPDVMLGKLDSEVVAWNRLDPAHPTQPALHLIVLVADAQPGTSGKYRTRHDSAMIEKVYGWAKSRNALLFLDLQVGQSTLQYELPWIEKFLVRPDVHLGIDPEFSMKKGGIPGKRIGTYDAADINYASHFLAALVEKHKLPPKILVVHRFTPGGVTNTKKITLDPRVQLVMHMDGFGPPWMKRDTYWRDIKREPVQFTGWKQFTKARNDRPPTRRIDILRLWPVPLYIQIQ